MSNVQADIDAGIEDALAGRPDRDRLEVKGYGDLEREGYTVTVKKDGEWLIRHEARAGPILPDGDVENTVAEPGKSELRVAMRHFVQRILDSLLG
jgi:hypothetical protein